MADSIKNRTLIAVIGDEDTITGMLLAGIGQVDDSSSEKNFYVVEGKTTDEQIDKAFDDYVDKRDDIAILLIDPMGEYRNRIIDRIVSAF